VALAGTHTSRYRTVTEDRSAPLTEDDFAPLLNAVPSYEPIWAQRRAEVSEDRRVFELLFGLSTHLAGRAAAGDFGEFRWMFAAVDRLYRTGNGEMDDQLTVGFLEGLIYGAAAEAVDPVRIAEHIAGSEAQKGWDAAYTYTHPPQTPRGRAG
jgi:hypothetical protein